MQNRRYVILDPQGRFFLSVNESLKAKDSFTDMDTWAWKMDSVEEAREIKAKLLGRLYLPDGENKIPDGYLRIAEITYKVVG